MSVRLVDAYSVNEASEILYELLSERDLAHGISHKSLPSFEEHYNFFRSRPYFAWYLIQADAGLFVGSIYLTNAREVGLFVFDTHKRRGIGKAALEALQKIHPGRLLANISPKNVGSQEFFAKQGFKLIQHTYER